jgi:hypothetical protein
VSWARYDDELTLNYKYGRLRSMGVNGMAALGLHLAANTYARHNGTAGVIEPHVPELLAGRSGPRLAAILVQVGMFDCVAGDAWIIHDFAEFHDPNDPEPNRSAAERKKEISDKRREAGRLGGLAKAGKASSKKLPLLQQKSSPVPVPTYLKNSTSLREFREAS